MYGGNKIPGKRYALPFVGACIFFQPIVCVSFSDAWQVLYRNATSRQNITNFFSSKYGLGLVGGAIAFALAGLWYTWKKNAEQQRRIQEQERLRLVDEQKMRDQEQKQRENLAEIQRLAEEKRKREEGLAAVQQHAEDDKQLLAIDQELKELRQARSKLQDIDKDFDNAMNDLKEIYARHQPWLNNAEDFYLYLGGKSNIATWSISQSENLLRTFKEKSHRPAICAALQGEYDQVGTMNFLDDDVRRAWSLLGQVIKLLRCEQQESRTE